MVIYQNPLRLLNGNNFSLRKTNVIISCMELLLEDDGGLDGVFQDEDYKKFLKSFPKELKNESK